MSQPELFYHNDALEYDIYYLAPTNVNSPAHYVSRDQDAPHMFKIVEFILFMEERFKFDDVMTLIRIKTCEQETLNLVQDSLKDLNATGAEINVPKFVLKLGPDLNFSDTVCMGVVQWLLGCHSSRPHPLPTILYNWKQCSRFSIFSLKTKRSSYTIKVRKYNFNLKPNNGLGPDDCRWKCSSVYIDVTIDQWNSSLLFYICKNMGYDVAGRQNYNKDILLSLSVKDNWFM